jgi:hypothetical protein
VAKTKDRLMILLIAAALGAGWLAIRYEYTPAIALVLLLATGFFWVSGSRMIVTRRARVSSGSSTINPHMELHSGFSAQLWGVLYLCFGVITLALAYLIWRPASAQTFQRVITEKPALAGLLLMSIGALIITWAFTRVLARKETWSETKLPIGDRWLQAISGFLTGSLLFTLGALRTFAPATLGALRRGLPGFIKTLLESLSK